MGRCCDPEPKDKSISISGPTIVHRDSIMMGSDANIKGKIIVDTEMALGRAKTLHLLDLHVSSLVH